MTVRIPWINTNFINIIKGQPLFSMRDAKIDMHLFRTMMLRLMQEDNSKSSALNFARTMAQTQIATAGGLQNRSVGSLSNYISSVYVAVYVRHN